MRGWPRITIGLIMIGIAVLALLLDLWRIDPRFVAILGLQSLLFLPLFQSLPRGED
jgi:hypothetical protein